ncbi:MAG: GNAT family N-acetyltransferase [Solirubrobacterales bacterium]|nr:GNAT family N-acetyltransferase [Solirubrobacterales bacterium]
MNASVRVAESVDSKDIARLLHAFNVEYGDDTPGPEALALRIEKLLVEGDTAVLLAGDGPDGVAVLRFRLSIWTQGFECYLAELYVAPEHRSRGLGRALMTAAIRLARERGADYMDLNTAETDVAARHLYESLGFSRSDHKPSGPVNFYYEREL